MSTFPSEMRARSPYAASDGRRPRRNFMERDRGSGGSRLLFAGLAVLALGALGLYYLGPDLRRYLKIERM